MYDLEFLNLFTQEDISENNNDFTYDNLGRVHVYSGQHKLAQDITKILLTELGTHYFHLNTYGAELHTQIGNYIKHPLLEMRTILEGLTWDAMNRLVDIQCDYENQGYKLDDSEVLAEVEKIVAGILQENIGWKIDCAVKNRKGTTVESYATIAG